MNSFDVLQGLQNGSLKVIDADVLRTLLSRTRNDIQKKICSARDARSILDMSENAFYEHLKDPKCLIRLSSKKGKYVLQSIYDEAERLNA